MPLFFLWVDCLVLFIYFWTKHDDLSLLIVCLFFSFLFFFLAICFYFFNLAWMVTAFLFFGWLVVFFSLYDFKKNKSIWENFYKLFFRFSYFSPQPKKKNLPPLFHSPNQTHTRENYSFFHPLTIFHPSTK